MAKNATPSPDGTSRIAKVNTPKEEPVYPRTQCGDCGESGVSPDGDECGMCSGQGWF